MYAYPIYLPEFSNREDLLLTVSIFDDDTGDPLDYSGCTRALPGNFTHNLWVVTTSNIVTTSPSVLTIPDYPIGDELQAVALTVDPGLNIVPGAPVTIADLPGGVSIVGPVGPPPMPLIGEDGTHFLVTEDSVSAGPPSTLTGGPNTMTGYVTSYAAATGAMVVQIGSTFQFEIRRIKAAHDYDYAYSGSWDFTGSYDYSPIIIGALGNGLMMVDIGVLQIRVPESTVRKLNHRTYGAYLTMTDSYDTRQVMSARLPVQIGGVSI